jgi:hypothetical protein
MRRPLGGKPKERRLAEHPEPFYSLADTARLLRRSRPTLMRWLAFLGEATGHSPIRDGTGRWLVPVPAVTRLVGDPDAVAGVVAAAARSRGQSISALREELERARAELHELREEIKRLRRGATP